MALRAEYVPRHPEFNDFLFAVIGEEPSGQELTVLSALVRLDLDPWKEAARLSELTKDIAAGDLAESISMLPEGDWRSSDSQSIAVRLIGMLPRHFSDLKNSSDKRNGIRHVPNQGKSSLWILIAATLALLTAMFVL